MRVLNLLPFTANLVQPLMCSRFFMQFCHTCTASPLNPSPESELGWRTELKSPGRAENWLRTGCPTSRPLPSDYIFAVITIRMFETKCAYAWFSTVSSTICTQGTLNLIIYVINKHNKVLFPISSGIN